MRVFITSLSVGLFSLCVILLVSHPITATTTASVTGIMVSTTAGECPAGVQAAKNSWVVLDRILLADATYQLSLSGEDDTAAAGSRGTGRGEQGVQLAQDRQVNYSRLDNH